MAERRATPEGRQANLDALKKWKQANPEKVRQQDERRNRAKGMQPRKPADPFKLTHEEDAFDRKHVRAARIVAAHRCDFRGWTDAEEFAWKYKHSPEFNIQQRMRASVRRQSKRFGWVPSRFGYEARRLTSGAVWGVVGYTPADLRAHLERQFVKGMSWDRLLAGDIHIDHITPVSSFDLDDVDTVRACYCLSNLRPMWAADNIRKRDKKLFLL